METVLRGIEELECSMDDAGVFGKDWQHHLASLRELQDNGFTVNPLKCEWCVQETNWLGHWLTPTGTKPCCKKIKPLRNLVVPKLATTEDTSPLLHRCRHLLP
jgi:hypothetical protein